MNLTIEPLNTIVKTATDFIQEIITPPLKETGLLLTDNIRYWRFKNQLKIVLKAEKYIRENNIKTKKVSLKTLAPLLENASMEEEESLQEKWAALLAHTVTDDFQTNTTLYSYILSQLTKDDAEVFEYLYSIVDLNKSFAENNHSRVIITVNDDKISYVDNLNSEFKEYKIFENFRIILDNLIRLRLITEVQTNGSNLSMIAISDLGDRFLKLCRFS